MIEISGTDIKYSRGDTLNLTFSADNSKDLIGKNDTAIFSIKDFSGSTILEWKQNGKDSTILQLNIPSDIMSVVPSGTHYWDLVVDFYLPDSITRITMNYMGKFICKDVAHIVPVPQDI